MNQAVNVSRVAVRAITTSAGRNGKALGTVPAGPRYQKIMEMQKLMTAQDGALVWQKRGARDLIPYYFTGAVCLCGLTSAFYNLYLMSYPKQ
ncbi:cytochrome c oxidase subunit 7A, mitochondrial-like [Tubulanus polymorphus]|uniref:cytochrome c oxidase subunit 7A, mitochondrial-like n=1 Tax=Tubulanus polymorphus TaxID=672921 RepID=UPI003DA571E5